MEHNEYLRRLKELAEVDWVKAPTTSNIKDPDEPDRIFRQGLEFELSKDHNPTRTLAITEIKNSIKACEDCGIQVSNRRVEMKLNTSPAKFWKVRCVNCNLCQNPDTGEFNLTASQLRKYYFTAEANRQDLLEKFSEGDK